MIIHLLSAAFERLASGPHDALENLLCSYKEGKHILTAEDVRSFDSVLSDGRFSSRAKGAAKSCIAKAPELNGLRKALPHFVEVGDSSTAHGSFYTSGPHIIMRARLDWFSDSVAVQTPLLLCENGDDSRLYMLFAEALISRRRWKTQIALTVRGGGGSDVAAQLRSDECARRMLLCILDSDRKRPEGALGATAKAALGVEMDDKALSRLEVLDCRELENLIPWPVVVECMMKPGSAQREAVAEIENARDRSAAAFWDFVDLKEGLTGYDAFSPAVDKNTRHFWLSSGLVRSHDCSEGDVRCEARRACKCVALPGLGEAVIRRVIEHLERMSAVKLAEALKLDDAPALNRVAELVASWGCSLTPFAT